ncbi:MAG TPA: zf-HC2 domain-containing protein, partial [Candidatus Dormibacteraeota bacterium]|nr:zf-HC2 domain-containing protein [Candidatus Dormibacteraeota bacterium]
MMCGEWEARLNEYVDGTLAASEQAAVDAHVAACPSCRAALAELRELVTGAAALPRSIEPGTELWADVARRITRRAPRERWWRERLFWAGAMAAAASLVIALGIARWVRRPEPVELTTATRWAAAAAAYDRAARELAGALAGARERLRPETAALVERNLRIVDAAIRESRD